MKCNNLLNIRSNINVKPSSIFAKVISTKIFLGVNRRSKLGLSKIIQKRWTIGKTLINETPSVNNIKQYITFR